VVYDPDADQPVYSAFSAANVNDITAAKAMPVEAGATCVFDFGYYDYACWAKLDAAGCRIVTRLKRNTLSPCVVNKPYPCAATFCPTASVISRRDRPITSRTHSTSRSATPGRHRRLQGLPIVTNDLTAPAQVIADLYKRRWAIEQFFRWVKQTFKITRFLGTSENAVAFRSLSR
jgi:hypothetical protein